MNYLTNYYKNLSEQLQYKVNYLEKMLKEEYNSDFDFKLKSSEKYPFKVGGKYDDVGVPETRTPKKQPETRNIGVVQNRETAEQARIAERAKKFPHLGPGYHSWEEHRAAFQASPNAAAMEHWDITPDTIHLATPYEIESAHQSLSIVVDSYDGDPIPEDVEKLEFLGKHLR